MEFKQFNELLQKNFKETTQDTTHLFEVNLDKTELWNLYLDSFPAGTNNMFRERREYDCCCCRHFIKQFGNVVMLKDNTIKTIWDFKTGENVFQSVINSLNEYVKSKIILDVWISKNKTIGTEKSFESIDNGNVIQWDHFYLQLDEKFIDKSNRI